MSNADVRLLSSTNDILIRVVRILQALILSQFLLSYDLLTQLRWFREIKSLPFAREELRPFAHQGFTIAFNRKTQSDSFQITEFSPILSVQIQKLEEPVYNQYINSSSHASLLLLIACFFCSYSAVRQDNFNPFTQKLGLKTKEVPRWTLRLLTLRTWLKERLCVLANFDYFGPHQQATENRQEGWQSSFLPACSFPFSSQIFQEILAKIIYTK